MKESYEKQISFPEINSSEMNIILEYIYTGSVKESLTKNNLVETFVLCGGLFSITRPSEFDY